MPGASFATFMTRRTRLQRIPLQRRGLRDPLSVGKVRLFLLGLAIPSAIERKEESVSVWKMPVAVAGSALLLSACGGGGGGTTTECSPKGASTAAATTTVNVVTDPTTVGAYSPKTITIKVGDTVAWDFQDTSVQHSVTEDNATFDSCLQSAGAKFSATFASAGTFSYHCIIHAGMVGTIKVQG